MDRRTDTVGRAFASVVGLGLVLAVVSGCGGDDGDADDAASSPPPNTAEPQGAEETASPAPATEARSYTVTFRVSGPEVARVEVGEPGKPETVEEGAELPWETEVQADLTPGGTVGVTAATLEDGQLTCEAVVDGEVVAEETDATTCSATFTAPFE